MQNISWLSEEHTVAWQRNSHNCFSEVDVARPNANVRLRLIDPNDVIIFALWKYLRGFFRIVLDIFLWIFLWKNFRIVLRIFLRILRRVVLWWTRQINDIPDLHGRSQFQQYVLNISHLADTVQVSRDPTRPHNIATSRELKIASIADSSIQSKSTGPHNSICTTARSLYLPRLHMAIRPLHP